MWIVLQNPAGQQHHHNALTAALGVPNNAAFTVANVLLGGFDADILMNSRQLFYATVKENEIVHQLNQPRLGAHREQVLVQLEARIILLVFLPAQKVRLRSEDAAVL